MGMDEYLERICKRFALYQFDADYICNLKGHSSRLVRSWQKLNRVHVRLERDGQNMSASKLIWEIIYQIIAFENDHELTTIHIVNSEVQPHMELVFEEKLQRKEESQ